MKKLLLMITFVACIQTLHAQIENKELYIYNRINIEQSFLSSYFTVSIRHGVTDEYLRNEKKQLMKFTSEAAVLLYFQLQGWEVYALEHETKGAGGDVKTYSYWNSMQAL